MTGDENSRWKGLATAGAVCCAVPFFAHFSTWNDGTYRDWIAIGGGIAGAILGIATLVNAPRNLIRKQAIAAGIGIVLFAGVQLARGFGVFEDGGGGDSFHSTTTFVESPVPAPTPTIDPNDPASCPDKSACFQLGVKLEHARDVKGAAIAYERACNDGAPDGCFNVGFLWSRGDKPDLARSIAGFQKGCDLGELDACSELARDFLDGNGVAKDVARAKAMFEKACDAKGGMGCFNLGIIFETGNGVPKDAARGTELYAKACDIDNQPDLARACELAGNRIQLGIGVKPDPARAVSYLTAACDREAARCFYLGLAFDDGDGVAKDPVKARELYGKSCDAGNADSCNNLGVLLNTGRGGAKDHAAALQLFAKACDGGNKDACANAAPAKHRR
ncbi:MAG TPA: tetratricopeptide repeat protein [Kofleriaceae bacterium]|jgi:hypothetical protein